MKRSSSRGSVGLHLTAFALLVSSFLLPPSSFAAKESAAQLMERALRVQADLGFDGVVRQDFATAKRFTAEAVVEFDHARRYKVGGLPPGTYAASITTEQDTGADLGVGSTGGGGALTVRVPSPGVLAISRR